MPCFVKNIAVEAASDYQNAVGGMAHHKQKIHSDHGNYEEKQQLRNVYNRKELGEPRPDEWEGVKNGRPFEEGDGEHTDVPAGDFPMDAEGIIEAVADEPAEQRGHAHRQKIPSKQPVDRAFLLGLPQFVKCVPANHRHQHIGEHGDGFVNPKAEDFDGRISVNGRLHSWEF